MPQSRPPYPLEFRQQMVELVKAGRAPKELAREFGCSAKVITNWLKQADRDESSALPCKESLNPDERKELVRLCREARQLQMERDILAKATAWFANKSEKTFIPSTNS